MPQTVAHGDEFADSPVQPIRLGHEHLPVDARPTVRREHERDFVEREAGSASQRDQRQPLQHVVIEQPAQAPPADRSDQPAFLVELIA